MKITAKIKGTLGMAGLSYAEFATLCKTTRQTLYTYLNNENFFDDKPLGKTIVSVSDKLLNLVQEGKLPLPKETLKGDVVRRVEELLG